MERPYEGVSDRWLVYIGVGFLLLVVLMLARHEPPRAEAQAKPSFVGGLHSSDTNNEDGVIAVRNQTAQPGDDIVTLRYFRIQKGKFPEFLKASQEGVWPYFEKLGSRVVGMWQIIHPEGTTGSASEEYDEVYLMTRYASVAHWRATRETSKHGGNGPDWKKCMDAIAFRRSLTLETNLTFLQGNTWKNPPVFMPAVEE